MTQPAPTNAVSDTRLEVERIISRACSAYADGLVRGPVKTRADRRADAIRKGVSEILALTAPSSEPDVSGEDWGGGDVIALIDPARWDHPDAPQHAYANGRNDALYAHPPHRPDDLAVAVAALEAAREQFDAIDSPSTTDQTIRLFARGCADSAAQALRQIREGK